MRLRVTGIIIGAILLFLALDFTFHHFVILRSYLKLEEIEAGKDMARCIGALQREIEHLDTLTHDWASWDDTYNFVQNRNGDYPDSNLVVETFSGNSLNLLFICNLQRDIVWGEVRAPDTYEKIDLAELSPLNIKNVQGLFEPDTPGEFVSGVWMTSRFPILVSSRPVTTSDDQGPIAGHLIMGRILTEDYIKGLAEQTQVPHTYETVTGNPPNFGPGEIISRITPDNPYVFDITSSDLMRAYTVFPDIMGQPALLLAADIDRSITASGHAALWSVLVCVFIIGSGTLVGMLLLLNRMVIRPLSDLTAKVVDFRENQQFLPAPLKDRRDEIGQLYREFEKMTKQLEKLHQGYRETNARLEHEVHEHTLTEKELWSNQERFRALSSELVMIEERERRRIAVDLHDRIGQALAVLRMQVEVMLKQAPVDQEDAGKIRTLIENVIQDSRTLIFEISPPVLYELGLGPAIEWLAEEIMEHHGIHIETEDRLEATIEDSTRALIFRSVRELLHNILKHAEADRAWVKLEQTGDDIRIVVEDNGVGINHDEIRQDEGVNNGFGLFSIQERFRQLGGRVDIAGGDRGGALITICIPLALPQGESSINQVEEL